MDCFISGFADELVKLGESSVAYMQRKNKEKGGSGSLFERNIRTRPFRAVKSAPDPKPAWKARKSSVRAGAMEPSRAAVKNVKDWNESVRGSKGNRDAATTAYEKKKYDRSPKGERNPPTPEQYRRGRIMSGPNGGQGWANFYRSKRGDGPGSVPGMLGKNKQGKNNLDGYIGGKKPPTSSEVHRKAEFGGISPKARLKLPGKEKGSWREGRYDDGTRSAEKKK